MKTQQEQIKEARAVYILPLSEPRNSMTDRYAVYLLTDEGLECLWPSDTHEGKSKELLPGQVYSKRKGYPAYHFALGGCGYSKTYEIRCDLQRINPALEVFVLTGYSPASA